MQILGKTGGSQRPQGQQEDVLLASLRPCFLIFPDNSRGTAGGELGRQPHCVSVFYHGSCLLTKCNRAHGLFTSACTGYVIFFCKQKQNPAWLAATRADY